MCLTKHTSTQARNLDEIPSGLTLILIYKCSPFVSFKCRWFKSLSLSLSFFVCVSSSFIHIQIQTSHSRSLIRKFRLYCVVFRFVVNWRKRKMYILNWNKSLFWALPFNSIRTQSGVSESKSWVCFVSSNSFEIKRIRSSLLPIYKS